VNAEAILYLSRREVDWALRAIDPVETVSAALAAHARGETILPDEAYLAWEGSHAESVRSLSMPAALEGIAGVKIINANPENPKRGLPRASGLTLLFDPETARPRCVMEGARISCLRTAAVTAIAADLLCTPRLERLALLGAGALAACHLELFSRRFAGLREIRIFDVRRARAIALARTANDSRIEVGASAEEAIRGAQLLVCVTTATSSYIPFSWLEPGTLFVNTSLDDPLPDVVLRADKVFVDDWKLVAADGRRLLGRMLREGLVAGPDAGASSPIGPLRRIDGELGKVLVGALEGRSTPEEIILVNPFGLAIEDLALAQRVYAHAAALGLGTVLEP
jgi:ornithine cyclodeaminase/alanine dehydrogenase-like protein (mu-crystallin family)